LAIKVYKPTTNGRRNMTSSDFAEITKSKPERTLLESQSHTAGRNSYGHITSRHRGGGHKQKYRIIDFKRNKDNAKAVVKAIEYDPNRTANIQKQLLMQSNMIQIELLTLLYFTTLMVLRLTF